MLRIVLCVEATEGSGPVSETLERLGHAIVGRVSDVAMLNDEAQRLSPDVLIVVTHSPGAALIAALDRVTRHVPRPIVVLADDTNREAIVAAVRAGASAYVVGPLTLERIPPLLDAAIARFEQLQALRMEAEAAKAQLHERKLVERAKGILMKSRKLNEEDAYRAMRKQAMDRKLKLTEVAQQIIAVADLLG